LESNIITINTGILSSFKPGRRALHLTSSWIDQQR